MPCRILTSYLYLTTVTLLLSTLLTNYNIIASQLLSYVTLYHYTEVVRARPTNPAPSPSPSLQTHDSVSVHVDLILPCRPLTVAYFSIWLVPLLAVSIDCFCNVEVQRCK